MFLFLLVVLLPVTFGIMQGAPAPRLEITGVNASALPTVTLTANVYDNVSQPITNLSAANFALIGDLASVGQIVSVQNITDQNLPIATVLVIDISTSMEGPPFAAAKDAARTFVQNIGANDPVAILTFSSGVTLYQPYTTDKSVLLTAIDNLPLGGETALYQAAYEAVRLAADSPVPRRAVVLLSDGAEYGGESQVGRGAALEEAIGRGVPVYTIGLGYGTDRTYLQELSFGTNARAYESPAPEQLTAIYAELAAILRSQYVITINLNVPADGQEYTLGLQVTTDGGVSTANASLRTPIPVPIIDLALPLDAISLPTPVTATIRADDAIQGVNFTVSDTEIGALLDAEPYTFTIDPAQFAPGTYSLAVSALDENGDIGTAGGTFTIAPLAPALLFSPPLGELGTLTEPVTVSIDAGGQTPITGVTVQFDGGEPVALEAPYSFLIDPSQFTPGEHTVSVSASNEGGQTASASGTFNAAALPPAISISGIEDGQTLDRPVDVTVTVEGQVAVSEVVVTAGGQPLAPTTPDGNTYTIDPLTLQPGGGSLTVSAALENGQSATTSLNFMAAALPPRIIVTGLTAGETLEANRDVEIGAQSQTAVVHIAVLIDGEDVGHFMSLPVNVTLDVLQLGAGDHVLRIVADNASGQSATLDVPFSVSPAPIATATQAAFATATSVQATQIVQATAAAVQATEFANATATVAQATSNAVSTLDAQATLVIEATATQAAAITATEQAGATATQQTILQVTQQIAAEQTSTQAVIDAQATSIVRSTLDAAATEFAQATSTQVAEVTRGAIASATAEAGATATAALTATQEAVLGATATQAAGATATEQAGATATQSAVETATQNANASATAVVEAQVATQAANETATQSALITATAQNTVNARETARAQIGATAQVETRSALETRAAQTRLEVQATQDARATRDTLATQTEMAQLSASDQAATQTQIANQTATQAAVETQNAVLTAVAQEALIVGATATEIIRGATATQAAVETQNAVLTDVASEALIAQAATATDIILDATATQSAVETAAALSGEATATQAAVVQNVTEAARAAGATQTGAAAATQRADILATDGAATAAADALTVEAQATRTAIAQATIEIRLSAVGPTPTPLNAEAQGAQTATPQGTPMPTATLVPIQAESAPATSNIIPIFIIGLVLLILLIVVVLILRRR